jgi:hypothetical protein
MNKYLLKVFVLPVIFICLAHYAGAQTAVQLNDEITQRYFTYGEIDIFADTTNKLTLAEVRSVDAASKFKAGTSFTPTITRFDPAYWYRIKINADKVTTNNWMLEFFDQTIDDIVVYAPEKDGSYKQAVFGDTKPFTQREFHHKNFTLNLDKNFNGDRVYYIRIKSHQPANVIVVLKSVSWFVHYAIDEYLFFGVFYGMILVFSLYNLMMFFAIRQKQYLYYIAYNLSIGLYEMCADGVAYQYLWPNSPEWNQYAYGVMLYSASIFALMFTQSLLYVKAKAPRLNTAIRVVIFARSAFFVACLINKDLFYYKIIEIVPLMLAFYTGHYIFHKGYRPARFFVIGYTFLMIGFIIKTLIILDVSWLPFGPVTHYSLSFCFIMEMLFISFAIGEKVRLLKKKKDKAQQRIINQMRKNEELKDALNQNLEKQVQARTRELIEKSAVIEQQNEELLCVNVLLQQQSEEISRMNVLLEKDNITLQTNIEKVTHDRVMSAEVDYDEFSRIYPDRETCFKFLSELKWESGYNCRRCNHDHYCNGHLPYSRRCSKCGYEESVIAYTILQNTRIPINKAFYMIFLVYSTKGKISSHKLSEILSIRQSTCWAYSTRIKKLMDTRKKELRNAGSKGWSKLVIELHEAD